MNSKRKIAKVYAAALLKSVEKEHLPDIYADLKIITDAFLDNSLVYRYFQSPLIPIKQKMAFIKKITNSGPAILQRYLLLLINKKRITLLSDIIIILKELIDKKANIQLAVVSSSTALKQSQLDQIKTNLSKLLQRTITVQPNTNISIGSGIRIEVGGQVIDNSSKKRLEKISSIFT